MKIRNKTSLWIALIALIVGVLSGFVVFVEMSEESYELIDRELLDLSERIISDLSTGDQRQLDTKTYTDRYFIKITDQSGEVVFRSSLAETVQFDLPKGKSRFLVTIDISYDLIWLDPDNGDGVEDLGGNGVLFRVVSEERTVNDSTFLVTAAKPLPFLAEDLREVRVQIIVWSIIASLLVICLSYLLAGRILLPLNIINSQIRDINQNSLSHRIPLGKSRDELFELTVSLNSMFDRLQYSFEKQRELIGNAAHEIKTPITTLLLGYENLLNKPLPVEVRNNLEIQLDIVQRVSLLVKNLLDISRLEQQESIQYDTFDLSELINEIISEFDGIIVDSHIKLTINTEKLEYIGDKAKIQRMLINIIDNAIKYNQPPGTIEISLNKSNEMANIEINNTSTPIPPDDYSRIFDQFYRVDRSHSSQTGGVGLGLTIVKRIVDLHDGAISVSSENGITSFKIKLPTRQI